MARLKLVTYPDPRLTTPALPYQFGALTPDQLAERIAAMVSIMDTEQGVGIAAPQVGWSTRICVIPSAIEGGLPRIMVNPKVVFSSKDKVKGIEACLSLPGVSAIVKRPREVEIEYFDPAGEIQRFTATGLVAQCAQHEVDHLDGILFVLRAEGVEQKRARKALRRLKTLSNARA